jgi:hypothetical protein
MSDTLPFTYDFFQENAFDTATFVDEFCTLLARMQTEGLNGSRVTSDGSAFQVKNLAWRDAESVQARGGQFSIQLSVPCIFHTLQNVMITLFKETAHYRTLVEQARRAAVFLRKPGARTAEELELSPQSKLLIRLLERLFDTMRVLEADDAPLACFVAEIADASYLERHAPRSGCADMAKIHGDAIPIVRCKCLSIVNSIFHLAYVLTPAGRALAGRTSSGEQ